MMKIRGGAIGTPECRSEDKVVGILSENFPVSLSPTLSEKPTQKPFFSLEVEGKLEKGSLGLTL